MGIQNWIYLGTLFPASGCSKFNRFVPHLCVQCRDFHRNLSTTVRVLLLADRQTDIKCHIIPSVVVGDKCKKSAVYTRADTSNIAPPEGAIFTGGSTPKSAGRKPTHLCQEVWRSRVTKQLSTLQLQAVPVVSGFPVPSDSAACGQDSGSRSTQPFSTLIFSSASFLCCYRLLAAQTSSLMSTDYYKQANKQYSKNRERCYYLSSTSPMSTCYTSSWFLL